MEPLGHPVAAELRRQLIIHWEQLRAVTHKLSLEIGQHRLYGQELLDILRFESSLVGNPPQVHIRRDVTENTELGESQKRSARLLRRAACVLARYRLLRQLQQEWVGVLVISNGALQKPGWHTRPPLWLYQRTIDFSAVSLLNVVGVWAMAPELSHLRCHSSLDDIIRDPTAPSCPHCSTVWPAVDERRWDRVSQEVFGVIKGEQIPAYLVSDALQHTRWILQRRINYGQCLGCHNHRRDGFSHCCGSCKRTRGVSHCRNCPESEMRRPYTLRYEEYQHIRVSWG